MSNIWSVDILVGYFRGWSLVCFTSLSAWNHTQSAREWLRDSRTRWARPIINWPLRPFKFLDFLKRAFLILIWEDRRLRPTLLQLVDRVIFKFKLNLSQKNKKKHKKLSLISRDRFGYFVWRRVHSWTVQLNVIDRKIRK